MDTHRVIITVFGWPGGKNKDVKPVPVRLEVLEHTGYGARYRVLSLRKFEIQAGETEAQAKERVRGLL